ncbi:enhancer of mRNA-decapping protein 4-like [Apium graveolens]|uniref:enhancer of mRNA-decapping protein 4-like n=1 Tax=Apium graveolens TaxID=4045 RepID=UPI003D7AC670
MASPGNPNQQPNIFFNPNLQNPNLPSPPFSLPNSSYPPPSSASYPPPAGPYPYPTPPQTSPFQHFHLPPTANLHHQRSIPFPTPPLQPPNPNSNPNPNHGARLMALLSGPQAEIQQQQNYMIAPLQPTSSGGSDISMAQNLNLQLGQVVSNVGNTAAAIVQASPMRMQSSKLPKGRHLVSDHVVYDIDVRLMGEVQPQLEVTPITKYGSDPGLVVGRQIAVNKSYICYGLKLGAIRVLNINTALRSLLKGLAQRVTDMAFFAEDVHLLASASVDGRVYIWKITEGPGEEEKSQITGKIVMAIQIVGEGDSVHPRVCWHCHKQEVLVVGIGKSVLRIDTTKVGKGKILSAEEPLKCPVDKLIDGVQFVGSHDGEVTDLSMCQWMTTRLVSASVDGTIKVWEDRKSHPIAVLRPHDGLPVNSATFLTSPHRPDHIILITGGPLNREVKIWTSTSEEGWLLPSDTDSWQCTQTLELRSSAAPRAEDVFFNQVVALSQAGLLLLANAKKNAIYAVHLEYGPNPAATRMDYIAEFTVTMPILSFTGTSDLLPHGDQVVQVYCVQTQAIQQYALDLSQCLPPPLENVLDRSDSSVSRDVTSTAGLTHFEPSGSKPSETLFASPQARPTVHEISSQSVTPTARNPLTSPSAQVTTSHEVAMLSAESGPLSLPAVNSDSDIASVSSPPIPLSPRLSRKLSGFRSPSSNFEPGSQLSDFSGDQNIAEYSVDRQLDTVHRNFSDSTIDDPKKDVKKVLQEDTSTVLNHPIMFKHPTHLVTPSEILRATSSSETNYTEHKGEGEPNIQDAVVNNDPHNVEVEVKVVGESQFSQNEELASPGELHGFASDRREKSFYSQAADLGIEMARESHTLPLEAYVMEESRQVDGGRESDSMDQLLNNQEEVQDSLKDSSGKVVESSVPASASSSQTTKGKKQKTKNAQGSISISPSPSVSNSTDSYHEPAVSSSVPSVDAAFSQLQTMQETINQLLNMQKELQKQMSVMVAVPVNKEGRRVETALGKSMEKAVKANSDALWARFQEENAKQEKLLRERTQQILNLVTNSLTKDLPAVLEKLVKKEIAAVGPAVSRTLIPAIEKAVSTAIPEAFQRGVGDKAVNQLEKSVNSRLEATVARHIQAQFQTSGKQILQEALKSSLETSVVPSFEVSCKAMFEQVDTTFQRGMAEHTSAAQHQFESSHSPLALALREIINSASSVTQTLSTELVDGQRKLLALAVAGASANSANPLVRQQSNGAIGGLRGEIEGTLDPTRELLGLVSEQKYEDAFTVALQRSDVSIVSWLCSQVDLSKILSMKTLPLSQGVLLSLLQQLACDISNDTSRKLVWMKDVAMVINPGDVMIAQHVKPIFNQVYQILSHQMNLPTTPPNELSSIRLVMHIINSLLVTCSK